MAGSEFSFPAVVVPRIVVAGIVGYVLFAMAFRETQITVGDRLVIGWGMPSALVRLPSTGAAPADLEWTRDLGSVRLRDARSGESRVVPLPEGWREAKQIGASPAGMMVFDITQFNFDDRHVIGLAADGAFILDKKSNELDVWPTLDPWRDAVRARTSLSPGRLKSPTSLLWQDRTWFFWTASAIYFLAVGVWVRRAFRRFAKPDVANTESDATPA